MDNKRKGSSPPSPPTQSGRLEWNEPSGRPFELMDDDDDGPLPAPPEFDGKAGRIPDLLDGDEVILEDAEVIDDGEVLDSALVPPVRASHSMPPPIPAPMPTGSGSRSFDDGEIALPPQISRYVQNFPFRKLRGEKDPSEAHTDDDEASPDTVGWRSAALNVEADDDDDDADELDPDELESDDLESDDDDAPPPPIRVAPHPPSYPPHHPPHPPRAPVRPVVDDDESLAFGDDDDDEPPVRAPGPPLRLADQVPTRDGPSLRLVDAEAHASAPLRLVDDDDDDNNNFAATTPPGFTSSFAEDATVEAPATQQQGRAMYPITDDDDAPLFADNDADDAEPPMARATTESRSESRWQLADRDEAPLTATSPRWSDNDEPVSADMFSTQLGVEPEAAPVALGEANRDPARMFSDDPVLAADTLADGQFAREATGENSATGMFRRQHAPSGPLLRGTLPADDDDQPLPSQRALELPADDDDEPLPQQAFAPPTDDDDELPQQAFAPPTDDDDEPPLPQHAFVPAINDDDARTREQPRDDDARRPAARSSEPPAFESSVMLAERLREHVDAIEPDWVQARPVQNSGAIAVDPGLDDDEEWVATVASPRSELVQGDRSQIRAPTTAEVEDAALGDGNWIATRPGASMASGAIPVADLDDDDDEWIPQPPVRPVQATPQAPIQAPAPVQAQAAEESDDDDEWEPQSSEVIDLAPAPTDLGEPFPLDLWSDPDELIGRELGRYRLVRPLSRDMTTRVYVGEDTDSGREVAVRILGPTHSPAEPRARQFIHEAQQLARLRSEHIVEVLETGTTSDHLSYYAMELLPGDTLASALRSDGPMHWAEVAAFANQICDALILAGERGIVHTDLSASTCVRLRAEKTEPGGEPRRDLIKLLDVGITPLTSGFRNAEGAWTLSQGTPVGAAEFMAPEIAGGGKADARTTVYALGVLMYELATGRPPFRGDSFISVLKKQMYEEPVPPRQVLPDNEIPELFEAIVLRALGKTPGDRFTDLRALDEALLAARAREGELRRVTQILALDPAFWDEDGSRRVKAPSAPLRAADPTPLATFATDLKQNQPALAAAVFGPRPHPRNEPSTSLRLTQLAPPITAPELPPLPVVAPVAPQMPVLVLARPPSANNNLFRTVSLSIVGASVLLMLIIAFTDRNRGNTRKPTEVSADSNRAATTRPPPRDPKRTRNPVAAVLQEPEVKDAPPPEPEVQDAPPPEPEPAKAIVPEEPVKAVVPEVKPPPVKPPPVKPPPAKTTPKTPPRLDDVPQRIEPGRLQSRLGSMEDRIATRCRARAGAAATNGMKVTVKVAVNVRGEVKATTTGTWAGTPMAQCIEEMIEAVRFNETHDGGSRTHTFSL